MTYSAVLGFSMSLKVLETGKLLRHGPAGERSLAGDKFEFNDHCGSRSVIAMLTQIALASAKPKSTRE